MLFLFLYAKNTHSFMKEYGVVFVKENEIWVVYIW